jgi:hypothetical protein
MERPNARISKATTYILVSIVLVFLYFIVLGQLLDIRDACNLDDLVCDAKATRVVEHFNMLAFGIYVIVSLAYWWPRSRKEG